MTSGNPDKTFVSIDGIEVTSFLIEWEMDNTDSTMINQITLTFHSLVNTLNPDLPDNIIGKTIVVKRGITTGSEDTIFQGFIQQIDKEYNKFYIYARDKLYNAVQRNVTKTFASNIDTEAGVISEIFKTLINDFTDLTADNTSVVNSGTDIILERFFCNNADVYERAEQLAIFLSWQLYYNPLTDLVHFEPQGNRTTVGTITVGTEIVERPKWIRDGSKKVKTLKVFGGPQEVETTEFFTGDNSEVSFTLANIPVSTKVFLDGVLQLGSVEGTVVDAEYSVDPGTKTIKFTIAPPSASNNVEVRYSYLSPIALTGENLIDYGLDLTLRKEELTTILDVENFVNTYLAKHSVDFIKSELKVVDVLDMDPGQTITVVDTEQNINQVFLIKRIVKRFPYMGDKITVDSEDVRQEEWEITTEDRIRRIEERLSQQESIVFILRNLAKDTVAMDRRYFIAQSRDITGGGPVYNNPQTFAIYNTEPTAVYLTELVSGGFTLGVSELGGEDGLGLGDPIEFNTIRVQQGDDLYVEDFHDTDFQDIVGTANWNTSTKELEFDAGEIGVSSSIDLNNGNIITATLISIESSGTFLYELAADGSTFETVTNGVQHVFVQQGNNLKWRVTESGATTGEISDITIGAYH